MDMVVRRTDFVNKKVELYDRLTSPAFRRADLVATTCEDPCDWQAAFEVPHDVSDCAHLSYDDLLIVRNGDDAPDVCQFVSYKPNAVRTKQEDSERVKEETEEDNRTCCVVGCGQTFPAHHPHGFHFSQLQSRGLCSMHYCRLQRQAGKRKRKVPTDALMAQLWKDEELEADGSKERAFKPCLEDTLTSTMEKLTVRFKKESTYGYQESVSFGRTVGDTEWQCLQSHSNFQHLAAHRDTTYAICQDLSCPVRTATNRSVFYSHLLRRMLDVQRILGNMVLFKCNVCKSRFPTFHPDFPPPFQPKTTATCPIDVATWDSMPTDRNAMMASFHTGVCQHCHRDLQQVEDHEILRGVAKLSAASRMDPLMGFPDDVRLRRHIQHIFDNATMLEVMLVSLQHMQVDTCHFY